ncbi:MAG: DUF5615 family PIN-like protein [Bacteroidetes bacterium]|nr:DUF5615 family PIN-like protein [Bacteroidota bacterium]MCW5894304.1 DUF5615 family PIN-like protein [Bacteroidota bacterium]
MKLLLDENVPNDLRKDFPAKHEVYTVDYMNWKGIKNGALLTVMKQEGFEALVTVDKGMSFQQSIKDSPVVVIVLRARSNTHKFLKLLLPKVLDVLEKEPRSGLFVIQ